MCRLNWSMRCWRRRAAGIARRNVEQYFEIRCQHVCYSPTTYTTGLGARSFVMPQHEAGDRVGGDQVVGDLVWDSQQLVVAPVADGLLHVGLAVLAVFSQGLAVTLAPNRCCTYPLPVFPVFLATDHAAGRCGARMMLNLQPEGMPCVCSELRLAARQDRRRLLGHRRPGRGRAGRRHAVAVLVLGWRERAVVREIQDHRTRLANRHESLGSHNIRFRAR